MVGNAYKRVMSLLMSAAIMFSTVSVAFFAKDNQKLFTQGFNKVLTSSGEVTGEDGDLLTTFVKMNSVLVRYVGTDSYSESVIRQAAAGLDIETVKTALKEIESLGSLIGNLSETDKAYLFMSKTAKALDLLYSVFANRLSTSPAVQGVAVLGGAVTVTDSQGTAAVSGNNISLSVTGGLVSGKTNTIDIYNNTDKISTLSFDYKASNYDSFTLNAEGNHSVLLYPDGNISLTLKSKAGYQKATLELKNISLVAAKESSAVTFDYDSSIGSVSVDGEAVSAGASKEITLKDGATLVATPKNGGTFLGWINPDNNFVYSTSATYKITPVADMTIKPVFVGKTSEAYFTAGDSNYLFSNLNNAADYALSSGSKKVVLINDGTLPAGNYTIPHGVTLLVPFNDANTVYTDTPEVASETRTTPTAYRTLTMASGANITVNGAISLPAKHFAAVGSKPDGGSPDGPCSFIKMESGSNITINSGAYLYAYGFITGSGTVVAKSGSKVYEYFQIMDFRGGSQTSDMKNGVFPLSQYYIQNIEVPMTIESGAVESCYTSVRMSGMTLGAGVDFLASSGAMFNLTSGSVVKYYDVNTDRLVFEVNGDISISPIELSLGSGLLTTKINSKNYELPINGNITVKVNSGRLTLAQDIAVLPGAEIIVGKNASCVVGSGVNIYVYDSAQWGNFCSSTNRRFIPVGYAPGRKYTRKDADIKDAKICVDGLFDASAGYLYTTADGADICSTGIGEIRAKRGSQTVTHQLVQNTGYTEIPITPAKLKNADGTYKEISNATYFCDNGVWREHTGHVYTENITSQPDCENNGVKTFTCYCGHSYTETIPAKGHNAGDAANCETAKICLTCGKELEAALGHDYITVVTNPTCTQGGFTTHTCQRCSYSYVDSEKPAKGHTTLGGATCTQDSACVVCGVVVESAKGHDYVSTVIAPTCEEKGYTTHRCTVCGDTYTDGEVAAKGHTAGAEATCTNPQLCTVCGKTLKSENGHTPGADATCTTAQTCTVCGEEIKAALGHEIVHNEATDATCTEDGFSSGSYCVRCDYAEGQHVIPAKGHKVDSHATCTTSGICSVCHAVAEPAKGHTYSEIVTLPTCTEIGYTTYTCTTCGHGYTDNAVKENGHTPGAQATCTEAQKCTVCSQELVPAKGHSAGAEATCTTAQICTVCSQELVSAKGHVTDDNATCLDSQICKTCGEELKGAYGHSFVINTTQASCIESGAVVHTCLRCRYEYIESETAATGHVMAAASCTAPATCLVCGHTDGEPLGHTEVIDEGIPSSCTQDGLTQGSHCSVCSAVIVAQQVIPSAGHNLTHHPAKEPTYTGVGWEAYDECSNCDYTTYVEIPKLENPVINDYETFIVNLAALEEIANMYAAEFPGKDPVALVIKYIRTGVDKYNEGSWGIMAGYEDEAFAAYVARFEDDFNASVPEESQIRVTSLKNLENFEIPNGDTVDFGHMFGTMDITYHNKGSRNHADVGGWVGDLVDLLEFSDYGGVNGTLDEMIKEVGTNYLLQDDPEEVGGFNEQDMYGDLDALYLMDVIVKTAYTEGGITELFNSYFVETLNMEARADYLLKNRLNGVSTRADVRNAVYNAYTGNKLITTLESTKDLKTDDVTTLRKACCYAFADYICELAGDYVAVTDNPCFTVFESESSILAPGIIYSTKKATSADNKQMVYYTATADLSRDDVYVYANYRNNDPTVWGMQPVLDQANAAQNKYGNPESDKYIENYNVIAAVNGDGYNMETGQPGGLLIMNGQEYHGPSQYGFFGITKDGEAVIGTTAEYNSTYKDQLQEAIGGFGSTLIIDGEICITQNSNYFADRASRTAVGITKTGKVVFMVLDGRQEPVSCGGSMIEIAHIMYEAGCVQAINLDGGGSTTFVARLEGDDKLSVANKPSDGAARSVSTSLMMVSTAPSSTAFDHAVIESEYDYMTKNTSVQLSATGVSATGNTAEIPEGTTWAVSDEKWGSITQDGVFTALRNGSVDVYLMLDGSIIGSKTINIVVPDRVYFTKTNINAIYGQKTELPVMALYENKPVKTLPGDFVFMLSNAAAGSIDGFNLVADESAGIKTVVVTAALANDSEAKASLNVALYRMDEISFDFDNAVGGDRTLAWNREVENATTDDNYTYEIIDTDKDMITNYTFAIDMTQIPIPEQLADLTDLLPGAELANASAWTFLMQLAERVSVLTEVKAAVKVDDNFTVDYSEVTLVNDYFELTNIEFDEETNTLTLTLNWIDQTKAIDPAMANPLCILKGIKLIPKEGVEWTNDRIVAFNTGEISYKMYMRASALYKFANQPENEAYGILPFVNPNDPNEKGGYFGATYAYLEDTYVLSKAVKDGWVNEEGGFAYYVDGAKVKGVQLIDGFYYNFGDDGINVGQTKYTGLYYDESEGVYCYSKIGELVSGWHMIDDDWHYFHSSTLAAKAGYYRVGDVYYTFEENGKVADGVWMKTLEGIRYYYGPSYYFRGWYEIDGDLYYFRGGYRYEGLKAVTASAMPTTWYDFGDDGVCKGVLDGIYYIDGEYRYIENGIATEKHLFKYGDHYYYSTYDGVLATDKTVNVASTNCDLPKGTYTFDSEGKMIGSSATGEIVELDGVLYYYENGKGVEKGLIKLGDYYYYAAYKGQLVVNKELKIPMTNCDLPIDRYEFGSDGRMLNGIVRKNGERYYYENGKGVEKGLIKIGDYYYYAAYKGKLVVDKVAKATLSNCDLPSGKNYEYGTDGKMLNGIVEKDGVLYYYENGEGIEKGLVKVGGDYYYAAYKGEIVANKSVKATLTSCDLPANKNYEFGADGKMLNGIVEKDGVLYYYENGSGVEKGLIKLGGDYYYAAYNGKLAVNTSLNPSINNCDLPKATYEFGADGKMLNGIVEKDGVLYYYENGKGAEKGLIKVGDDYYYSVYKGQLVVGKELKASVTNCDLPAGVRYEFDADGKMLNGMIEKNGVPYYYVNGVGVETGLTKIGDDYYYIAYKGQLAVGKELKAALSSCDLPAGKRYEFGPDGKMLNGIVEKDGVLYYYENGVGVEKGLIEIDGYYYYTTYKGKLAVNTTAKITATNNLLVADTYTFDENGRIIGN